MPPTCRRDPALAPLRRQLVSQLLRAKSAYRKARNARRGLLDADGCCPPEHRSAAEAAWKDQCTHARAIEDIRDQLYDAIGLSSLERPD